MTKKLLLYKKNTRIIIYPVIMLLISASVFQACNDSGNTDPNDNNTIVEDVKPFYPLPTPEQLAWQEDEMAMFIHFGINTFTGNEWGDGTENPSQFNPAAVDVQQWVNVAKETGFKLIILTAKHHDGFCLWPSAYTEHSIKNSPYKNGQGDIVKELSDACRNAGIKFGFYLSPWDRNQSTFGTSAYDTYYMKQMQELCTNYGTVTEIWLDAANGSTIGATQHPYKWNDYYNVVRQHQPGGLIAIAGPDIRWVGNEDGLGSETEWCPQPPHYTLGLPGDTLIWYPSEADVSIRPGWFYHEDEDNKVKSLDQLLDIYFKSIGRNSNLLLNVPPDKNGVLHSNDVSRLREFKAALNDIFNTDLAINSSITADTYRGSAERFSPRNLVDGSDGTYWATDDDITTAVITLDLGTETMCNVLRLEEAIEYGQRISSYTIEVYSGGVWLSLYNGTTIGKTRLHRFAAMKIEKLKLTINSAKAGPVLDNIGLFYYPPFN